MFLFGYDVPQMTGCFLLVDARMETLAVLNIMYSSMGERRLLIHIRASLCCRRLLLSPASPTVLYGVTTVDVATYNHHG